MKQEVTPYWYKDTSGMVLVTDDPDSWRDSIGRNLDAYVAYEEWILVESVCQCFEGKELKDWQRHPTMGLSKIIDLSRDHISYALISFYISKNWTNFYYILNKLKWKVNEYTTLCGMWLWVQTLKNSKWQYLYYAAKIPEMSLMSMWNWLVRKVTNIKPERSQAEWDLDITRERTATQRIATKLVFPAYALHNMAWQVKILPDTWGKRLLQKIMLPMVGRHNYVVKSLLGHKLTIKELKLVNDYQSMTGSRWTTTLDELNDRDVKLIDKERVKEYDLDKDYLLGILKIV